MRTSLPRTLCSVTRSSVRRGVAGGHRAMRLRRVQQRLAQEAPGGGARIGDQIRHRAGADQLAAAHPGLGPQVEHVVGAADGVLVVLDHHQRVAVRGELGRARRAGSRCRADAARWWAHRARSTRPAGSSRAARRGGCAAPRRPRASARRDRAAGSRGRRARGTSAARGSPPAGRARSGARARRVAAARRTARCCSPAAPASAAIERSRKRTLSAIGLRRCPWQARQAHRRRARTTRSTTVSSPLCSASNPAISTPVPKQLSHQPWLELNENRRGSSSAKLVPQEGQARRVENTVTRVGPRRQHVHQRPCRNRARARAPARSAVLALHARRRSRPPAARWCARGSATGAATARSAAARRRRAACGSPSSPPTSPDRCSSPCAPPPAARAA